MTREEAINVVKIVRQYLTAGNSIFDAKKINETMRMVIEALSEKNCVKCKYYYGVETKYGIKGHYLQDEAHRMEEQIGKWEYCEHEIANHVDGYKCSHCGFFIPWDYMHKSIYFIEDYNFCPSCGADMRGEK